MPHLKPIGSNHQGGSALVDWTIRIGKRNFDIKAWHRPAHRLRLTRQFAGNHQALQGNYLLLAIVRIFLIPKALRFDLRLLGDLGVEKAF